VFSVVNPKRVALVIPALNEVEAIGDVVRSIPREVVDEVIVVDNGSTDQTAKEAARAGALVVSEPIPGYGRACRRGAEEALTGGAQVLVFLDGDGSDCPEFMPQIVRPVINGEYDFVIGSRIRGRREPGSLNAGQLLAGKLSGWLLHLLYGTQFTDMSPFRAIRSDLFRSLGMRELTYGWNLEMQMLVAQRKARILEIPVGHRNRRGGVSKVSGSLPGSVRAAVRIFQTFCRVVRQRWTE
jgi:glycosyltransferase involved in cell wall biosynthesis